MFRLPVIIEEPLIREEPVRVSVSIEENVELPETTREPLIMAPLDAVTDEKWASLPLTISFFQVGNSYSVLTIIGFIVQYI
jgi:hypothetical protein